MVKHICQINGGFIMLFRKTFLKSVALIVNNMERINTRQRNTSNRVQCSKSVQITFLLPKCYRSIDNSIDFNLICGEKAHDSKNFSHENSKSCSESQTTTR